MANGPELSRRLRCCYFLYFWGRQGEMSRLSRMTVGLMLAVGLAGCAKQVLYKPGANAFDFETDKSACEYEALKYAGGYDNSYASAVGSAMDMAIRRNELTMACMRQKGWHPAPTSNAAPEKFTPTKVDLPS